MMVGFFYTFYFCVSLKLNADWTMLQRCLNRDWWKSIYAPTSLTSTHVIALRRRRDENKSVQLGVMFKSQPIRAEADKYPCLHAESFDAQMNVDYSLSHWRLKPDGSGCYVFLSCVKGVLGVFRACLLEPTANCFIKGVYERGGI